MREYLKNLRLNINLSQQQVAESAHITRQYYNMIENGERQKDISLSVLSKLSVALKTPLSKLVQLENEYQAQLADKVSIAK